MAFCNSCGATLEGGTRFCNKCGAAVLASTLPPTTQAAPVGSGPAAAQAAPQPSQGSGAVKIILIVVAVIVVLGILGMASIGFVAWRVAKRSHVRQEGNRVKVETPFGTVESNKDPEEAARNLGVDLYPGAKVMQEGAASATIAGVHTVSAHFESDDSVEKISAFYKAKFPNAMVSTSDQNQCTIVSNDRKNMITISIVGMGDKTRIEIASVSQSSGSKSSSE